MSLKTGPSALELHKKCALCLHNEWYLYEHELVNGSDLLQVIEESLLTNTSAHKSCTNMLRVMHFACSNILMPALEHVSASPSVSSPSVGVQLKIKLCSVKTRLDSSLFILCVRSELRTRQQYKRCSASAVYNFKIGVNNVIFPLQWVLCERVVLQGVYVLLLFCRDSSCSRYDHLQVWAASLWDTPAPQGWLSLSSYNCSMTFVLPNYLFLKKKLFS